MAKRTPRSQPGETTDAAEPKPRTRSRSRTAAAPMPETTAITSPPAEADDAAAPMTANGPADPSHDDIRHRAYERYLQRGGGHGMDFDDWLEAERELKNQR